MSFRAPGKPISRPLNPQVAQLQVEFLIATDSLSSPHTNYGFGLGFHLYDDFEAQFPPDPIGFYAFSSDDDSPPFDRWPWLHSSSSDNIEVDAGLYTFALMVRWFMTQGTTQFGRPAPPAGFLGNPVLRLSTDENYQAAMSETVLWQVDERRLEYWQQLEQTLLIEDASSTVVPDIIFQPPPYDNAVADALCTLYITRWDAP